MLTFSGRMRQNILILIFSISLLIYCYYIFLLQEKIGIMFRLIVPLVSNIGISNVALVQHLTADLNLLREPFCGAGHTRTEEGVRHPVDPIIYTNQPKGARTKERIPKDHPKTKGSKGRKLVKVMMVDILESTFVVPLEETPRETLMLSNLDLVATRKHNCFIYLYKNTEGVKDFLSADVLKSALAKALVLLYPLAGRHVVGQDGRDQIVCNAEGILFQVAQLDRTADSIEFEPMSRELRELFIPKEELSKSLILMMQVTYLKCGSVVLGTSQNHIIIDGQTASHLYQTWSRIARGDLKSIVSPSFDNTPIRARSPPKISFDFPEITTEPQIKGDDQNCCVLSVLRLSKEQVSHLKSRCSQYHKATNVSTFSVVSALVWKCYCIAQGLQPDSKSRLYFTVDIRRRLYPPLTAYCGNAVMRMSATSQVSKVTSNPIGDVAATVKAAVDRVTDEYIRSYIDYLEVKGMQIKKISPAESDLRIRSMLGMGFPNVDFGWGPPQVYSCERYTENRVIYIVNEPGKDGCLKVVPALDSSIMKQFKKVFHKELLEISRL